jgi:hypothetical protein
VLVASAAAARVVVGVVLAGLESDLGHEILVCADRLLLDARVADVGCACCWKSALCLWERGGFQHGRGQGGSSLIASRGLALAMWGGVVWCAAGGVITLSDMFLSSLWLGCVEVRFGMGLDVSVFLREGIPRVVHTYLRDRC